MTVKTKAVTNLFDGAVTTPATTNATGDIAL